MQLLSTCLALGTLVVKVRNLALYLLQLALGFIALFFITLQALAITVGVTIVFGVLPGIVGDLTEVSLLAGLGG